MKDRTFFCSWSGGKDSALALYKIIQREKRKDKIKALVTMCIETGLRSRSHGLSVEVLRAQAQAIGIPLLMKRTSWELYKKNYVEILRKLNNQGISRGIFGDIDIDTHRHWEEELCSSVGMQAELPLWGAERTKVIDDLLNLKFKAIIVSVNAEKLSKKYLGRLLDKQLIQEFKESGIDVCGENGEYHTVVVDGPIFQKKLILNMKNSVLRDGYWFQDFAVVRLEQTYTTSTLFNKKRKRALRRSERLAKKKKINYKT